MNFTEKFNLLMKTRGLSRRQFALQSSISYPTIVIFYEIWDIVVSAQNEESCIKFAGRRCFESINPEYSDIQIREDDSFRCFGVVLGKIHTYVHTHIPIRMCV